MTKQSYYENYILAAYKREKNRFDEEFKFGLSNAATSVPLFGYCPPRWMLDFGAISAFLYARNKDPQYALQSKSALLFYREWLKHLPDNAPQQRPEYSDGIPPLEPVFYPSIFVSAVQKIREILTNSELDVLISMLADALKPILRFPEWGGHNRAMLRAAGLALAAQAFPNHNEAKQWGSLADELAEESWGRWSIEDAMLYQPHWLRALFLYAKAMGRETELVDMIPPRMFLKATTQLISPIDILPDYGDSHWLMHSHWEWMACLEWGARMYQDASMKWTANRIYEGRKNDTPSAYLAMVAGYAWEWCDDTVTACPPVNREDALDDLVVKKIIWRTGWDANASYACLNYRDEGDYGRVARDYLRTTLAVSAEKMHHGHADEGSFSMLVHNGTLLLHESGYREEPPDGIYRSAMYHNRLVWRCGQQPGHTGLLEFLRGDGRYQPVRTERLYQTHLGDANYHRIRVSDEYNQLTWDRSIIFIPSIPVWVVIDSVLALRSDIRTVSSLWWTTDILSEGDNWYDTYIRGVQDWDNRDDARLRISFPTVPYHLIKRTVEPFRRHFQDELAIVNTWCGEHRAGKFVNFVSVLWPYSHKNIEGQQPGSVEVVESSPQGRGIGVRMHWMGNERLIGLLNDLTIGYGQEDIRPTYTAKQGNTEYDHVVSDAALVMVKRGAFGEWTGFINGTYLACDGKIYYEGLPHAMFQENKTALPGVPARFRWESITHCLE
jgi:hypothetical protein